jgi:photosystem II stability/assembly factor-like uncharacterized protein
MSKIAYMTLLCACVLLIPENSKSEWTRICRPGGDILSLAFSGNTLYGVGSIGRMVYTTNSGEGWTSIGNLYNSFHDYTFYRLSCFQDVSLLGASGGRILAGNPGDGSHWSLSSNNGTDDILAFAESRGKAGVRFLAGGFGGGIRVSDDSGKTWIASNTGLVNVNVTSLVSGIPLPDSSGQVIFAGTYGDGVFASTNNGQSWLPKNRNISTFQINGMDIADDHLYVAGSGGKVFGSSDSGNSWQEIGTGLPFTELLCITKVKDALNEWIYCGTLDAGLWRCPVVGGVWTSMNAGLANLRVNSIEVKDGGLFIGTHEGVYRSWDWGMAWTLVGEGGKQLTTLHAVPLSPPNDNDLLVTGTFAYQGVSSLFSSTFSTIDGGMNWNTTADFFSGYVVSITHQNELIFLLSHGTGDFPQGGLHVSSDLGATWEPRLDPITVPKTFSCMAIVPKKDGTRLDCFIATEFSAAVGVFFSSDTGRSWTRINAQSAGSMGAIDTFLIIHSYRGTSRTSNYGATWDTITSSLAGNEVLSFVNDGERLLACVSCDPANSRPGGVLMTTDAGDSWVSAGLSGRTVTSLVPMDNHLLAAADGKIYAAARANFNWVDVTGNLPGTNIGLITATPEFCYGLESDGRSIWKRPMTEILQVLSFVPAPPQLLAPSNGITGQPVSVNTRWTRPTSATTFWLQVAADSMFTNPLIFNNQSLADTFAQVTGLNNGQKYFWRVAAGNSSGFGPFSTPWAFRITQIQASAPDLVYPPNNIYLNTNVVGFVWRKANPAVTRYWLELATDSVFQFRTVDSLIVDTTFVRTVVPGNRYWWHVRAYNSAGWGPFSEARQFILDVSGIDEDHAIPSTFVLNQNFPNPFNPCTTIQFGLPERTFLSLRVFNTLGEQVAQLENGDREAGYHSVTFDASRLASGVYFYRIQAGTFVETRRLLLLR